MRSGGGETDMLFTLVLGSMVGGAAVLLLQQWVRDSFSVRPARVSTPRGYVFLPARPRRAA
jgi:hypothetical protein